MIPKSYKVEELKLGAICDIISGISFKTDDYVEIGIPVIKAKDIQNNIIQTKNLNFFCKVPTTDYLHFVQKDDLVIVNAGKGSVGKIGINLSDSKLICTQDIFKLVPNLEKISKKYLYHLLLNLKEKIENLVTEGVILHLYKTSIKQLEIFLPPLSIQEDISNILDTFMSLEQELEQRKQQYEYYRNLLIGEPIKIYKNIEIKEYLLGDVCEVVRGASFREEDYINIKNIDRNFSKVMPVLKVKDIEGGRVQTTNNLIYCDSAKFSQCKHRIECEDVVIINVKSSGGKVGKIGINLTDMEFLFVGEIFKLVPDSQFLIKKYFYYYLENSEKNIDNLVNWGNHPHLYKNSLEKLKLSIPPLHIQQDIVKKLDKFTDLLNIEGALKEEILFRKQQYEGYRSILFKKYCKS